MSRKACRRPAPLSVFIAGLVVPGQAGGSLASDGGKVVGSALPAQDFADARYFHPRPSPG